MKNERRSENDEFPLNTWALYVLRTLSTAAIVEVALRMIALLGLIAYCGITGGALLGLRYVWSRFSPTYALLWQCGTPNSSTHRTRLLLPLESSDWLRTEYATAFLVYKTRNSICRSPRDLIQTDKSLTALEAPC